MTDPVSAMHNYNAHVSQLFSYPFSAVGLIEYMLFVDVTASSDSGSAVTVVVAVVVAVVVVAAIVVVVVIFIRRHFVCELQLRRRCAIDCAYSELEYFNDIS